VFPNCYQRAGLYAGCELLFVRRQPLLIENIKLNLRTKVESYLSSPNHSLDLQIADVTMSSPAFANTFVGRSISLVYRNFKNVRRIIYPPDIFNKASYFIFLENSILYTAKAIRIIPFTMNIHL